MNKSFLFLVLALGIVFATQAAETGKRSLKNGDRVVLTYNADYQPSPDTEQPYYGRSGFIHPVRTPSGRIVTDDFPADHLHQHGVMFAWTTAVVDGRPVDFWNSKKQAGRVEHVETVHSSAKELTVKLKHVDLTGPKPAAALNETWKVNVVPHKKANVFDLVSTQTCATDQPVKMTKYHYGAMCIRGAEEWMNNKADMRTDEGKDRKPGNHSRPRWVVMSGEVDGKPCGIAAMSHPTNFRAPQPVRLHPSMPYFCFAPMVLGDFEITPKAPYVSRFRIVAFDGKPNETMLENLWKKFTEN